MIFSRISNSFFRLLSLDFLERLLIKILRQLNNRGKFYTTYQKRPKYANDINFSTQYLDYTGFAIVLQGPVLEQDDFTVETIKLYSKNFSGIKIIVSSWKDTSTYVIKDIENAGAIFIANEKPTLSGSQNINLQIRSTIEGLKLAQNLGASYIVKSRTDQRIYNPYFLKAVQLLEKFKVGNPTNYGLKCRLIIGSMSTLKYRPYGATDMFMLGHTEDLISYWNCPLDYRNIRIVQSAPTVGEYATYEIAETYILANFLKRQNIHLNYSISQTWQVYKDIFIILDKATLNIYWNKYSVEKENRLDFYEENVFKEISFLEGLIIGELHPDENVLDENLPPYNP